MSRIQVNIDRLVLRGIAPPEAKVVAETLQFHLSQLLANRRGQAPWPGSRLTPVLKLGPLPLEGGAIGARNLGKQVAGDVARGLKR